MPQRAATAPSHTCRHDDVHTHLPCRACRAPRASPCGGPTPSAHPRSPPPAPAAQHGLAVGTAQHRARADTRALADMALHPLGPTCTPAGCVSSMGEGWLTRLTRLDTSVQAKAVGWTGLGSTEPLTAGKQGLRTIYSAPARVGRLCIPRQGWPAPTTTDGRQGRQGLRPYLFRGHAGGVCDHLKLVLLHTHGMWRSMQRQRKH